MGNVANFLTHMELILHALSKHKGNIIVCGDFNVNYLVDSHKRGQLDDLFCSCTLSTIITFPTRIGPNSATAIDNIFLDNQYYDKYEIFPVMNGLSDHEGQFLTLHYQLHENEDSQKYYIRNINKCTIQDFQIKLSYESWETVFNEDDVNTSFNAFLNTFLRHFYSSFPRIQVHKNPKPNSWITTGIMVSCRHKRVLYTEVKKVVIQ
jgi:hypothetical protein